jgi:hypothetical protein
MKVRILTDTIPQWLVGPLLEHHERCLICTDIPDEWETL